MKPPIRSLSALFTLTAMSLALATCAQAAGKRVALLIGIADYQYVVTSQGPLQGPANDVAALAEQLTQRWGFAEANIRTLVNDQATRKAILDELRALGQRSQAGDDVFIFYSGHGTSALDSRQQLQLPNGSGAMVPYDFQPDAARPKDGLIVGRDDLKPILEPLEANDRRLWVVSDSCYSGEQVRSTFGGRGGLPGKYLPLAGAELKADMARSTGAPAPPYPYRRTAFLSASAEGEVARDIPAKELRLYPTIDGKAHGAMTDALLRVLKGDIDADYDRDGYLSWAEIHAAVGQFMGERAYGQSPQRLPAVAEDSGGLAQRAFLGQRLAGTARPAVPTRALKLAQVGLDQSMIEAIQRVPGVQLIAATATDADVVIRKEGASIALYAAAGDLLGEVPAQTRQLIGRVQQLGWAQRLGELGRQHARGLLEFQVQPAIFGGNFRIGERINFVVKPQRESTLLIIDVNAEGFVTVLYPHRPDETAPLSAHTPRVIPGTGPYDLVKVTEPPGMDMLFAFAFDPPPAQFERVLKLDKALDATDPQLALIETMISERKGEFTFARAELRVLPAE